MIPCAISYLMSCAINIKWLEGVWATSTIGGRVNRRDKKAAAQMNVKASLTLSLTVLTWGSFSPENVLCGPHSLVRFMRVK